MAILVTGGAGYIGSHTVAALVEGERDIIILDHLVQGHKEALIGGKLYEGDLVDAAVLDRIFTENNIEAVIHFAAHSLVGESMTNPTKYYHNNVYGTLCLLEKMVQYGVNKIVFSSTAAVYGNPEQLPIGEFDKTEPTNVYGETKLAMEKMIRWFDVAHGVKFISLRYFNAAGAHLSAEIGEDHTPETHLIPLILNVALGKRAFISVYGDDYDTEDGTCIRDYIHVSDLAAAHILAVDALLNGAESNVYNLGNGKGFSVKQVIETVREVTGHPIPANYEARRAGDPAVLVASADRAKAELGWQPQYADLNSIVSSAWQWHSKYPNGYKDKSTHQ